MSGPLGHSLPSLGVTNFQLSPELHSAVNTLLAVQSYTQSTLELDAKKTHKRILRELSEMESAQQETEKKISEMKAERDALQAQFLETERLHKADLEKLKYEHSKRADPILQNLNYEKATVKPIEDGVNDLVKVFCRGPIPQAVLIEQLKKLGRI